MDFNQLKEAYLKVLEENRELKIEINKFRQQLILMDSAMMIAEDIKNFEIAPQTTYCETIPMADLYKDSIISKQSSPQEKIDLFLSLFKGREDVCAKQWIGKDNKPGYSPYCYKDWAKGLYKEINRYWMKEFIKKLSNSGIIVIFKNDILQKFAVLDDEIIWYGSLSLLGYHSEEDTIMRLENFEIANELLRIIETGGEVE